MQARRTLQTTHAKTARLQVDRGILPATFAARRGCVGRGIELGQLFRERFDLRQLLRESSRVDFISPAVLSCKDDGCCDDRGEEPGGETRGLHGGMGVDDSKILAR